MTRAQIDQNLKQALAIGTPVEIYDPSTNEVYYLVSAEQFQKIGGAVGDAFDPRAFYPIVEQTMSADDLLDPLLDSYQ